MGLRVLIRNSTEEHRRARYRAYPREYTQRQPRDVHFAHFGRARSQLFFSFLQPSQAFVGRGRAAGGSFCVRTSLAAATASALLFLSKRAASLAACSSVMSSLEAPVRWHEDVKSEKHLLGKEVVVLIIRTDIWVEARVVRGIVRVARSRDLVSHGGILYIRVAAERRISSISLLDHDHNTYSLVLLALCTRRKTILPWLCLQRKKREAERGKQTQRGSQIPTIQRKLGIWSKKVQKDLILLRQLTLCVRDVDRVRYGCEKLVMIEADDALEDVS
jgi:hypothetical protein